MPAGITVIAGQANRVSEPSQADFVVFTAISRRRLSTNVDTYADCQFMASIADANMTVSAVQLGAITVGNQVFGVSVAASTTIISQTSGAPGGAGVYVVSQGQTVASATLASGAELLDQSVEILFQIDVHGPNSADNAQTISTLFRDDYATAWWASNGFTTSSPLYTDDPKQVPFINAEQQYETRWIVEARVEADQSVAVPMQFADALGVTLFPASSYPA